MTMIVVAMLFVSATNAQTRGSIAVLDFQTGANIAQSQVEGVSDMFLTFFSPQGFTLVERTQIQRVMREQGFQHSNITDADAVPSFGKSVMRSELETVVSVIVPQSLLICRRTWESSGVSNLAFSMLDVRVLASGMMASVAWSTMTAPRAGELTV